MKTSVNKVFSWVRGDGYPGGGHSQTLRALLMSVVAKVKKHIEQPASQTTRKQKSPSLSSKLEGWELLFPGTFGAALNMPYYFGSLSLVFHKRVVFRVATGEMTIEEAIAGYGTFAN